MSKRHCGTENGSIRDFCAAFTRIGNALGLDGTFLVHFGYEQIETKAKEAVRDRDQHRESLRDYLQRCSVERGP